MGQIEALASEPRSDSGARAFGVAVTQRLALGGQRELQLLVSRGQAAAQPKFVSGRS